MNSFTYNGTSSNNWGLIVDNVQVFNAPAPDYESVAVAGRNGELTLFNNRYNNVQVIYTIGITTDFINKTRAIADWLLASVGYHTLTDTYQPSYYRQARFVGDVEYVVNALCRTGSANVVFDCKPQLFLNSGTSAISVSNGDTITNPTNYPAKPLLRLYGTGTAQIGNYEVTVTTADGYTDIDCEQMNCYKGTTNCNGNVVIDDFPMLESGANTITYTGFTQVEITPNWWRL